MDFPLTACVPAEKLTLAAAENLDLRNRIKDLESRVDTIEKEVALLREQQEKTAQENSKRDEELSSCVGGLVSSLSSKVSIATFVCCLFRTL